MYLDAISNTRVLPVHIHCMAVTTVHLRYLPWLQMFLVPVLPMLFIANQSYVSLRFAFPPTSILLSSQGSLTCISPFMRKYLSFSGQWHFDS